MTNRQTQGNGHQEVSQPSIHGNYLDQSDGLQRPKAPLNGAHLSISAATPSTIETRDRSASAPPDPFQGSIEPKVEIMGGVKATLGYEPKGDLHLPILALSNTDDARTFSASGSIIKDPEVGVSRQSALATVAGYSPHGGASASIIDNGSIVAHSQQETAYQDIQNSVKLIRPYPVKTTPPTKGGLLLATVSGVLFAGRKSPAATTKPPGGAGSDNRKEGRERKTAIDKAWCEQAAVSAQREKEVRRKRNTEELRRQQEHQCAFLENDSNNMPPTSGRVNGDALGSASRQQVGYSEDYNMPQQIASQQQPGPNSGGIRQNTAGGGGRDIQGGRKNAGEDDLGRGDAQPTPYFERLVTEEVQSLKTYARIMENQNRRLAELERVHGDLEGRLEVESRVRQQLETTLESREREWTNKFEQLSNDRDHWKQVVQMEQAKNARLMDQMNRKDQDIHRMLQRKYDHEAGRSTRNVRSTGMDRGDRPMGAHANTRSADQRNDFFRSPHEILEASGSVEKARVRNVKGLLFDFFAM